MVQTSEVLIHGYLWRRLIPQKVQGLRKKGDGERGGRREEEKQQRKRKGGGGDKEQERDIRPVHQSPHYPSPNR